MHDRPRCRTKTKSTKDEDRVISVKKTPQHPHGRIKQKTVKFDVDLLKAIPYINIEVLFTSRYHKDKIIDGIIKNSPADINRYYIDHKEGNTIFNTKKKSIDQAIK